jgi:hypothetical protein
MVFGPKLDTAAVLGSLTITLGIVVIQLFSSTSSHQRMVLVKEQNILATIIQNNLTQQNKIQTHVETVVFCHLRFFQIKYIPNINAIPISD